MVVLLTKQKEMKLKVKGYIYNILSQFYIIPTIKITHNKYLYGYYSIDLVWGKWGLSLTFN